jgi:hypothetical protein
VLTILFTLQLFQSIPRGNEKLGKLGGSMQDEKFSSSSPPCVAR